VDSDTGAVYSDDDNGAEDKGAPITELPWLVYVVVCAGACSVRLWVPAMAAAVMRDASPTSASRSPEPLLDPIGCVEVEWELIGSVEVG